MKFKSLLAICLLSGVSSVAVSDSQIRFPSRVDNVQITQKTTETVTVSAEALVGRNISRVVYNEKELSSEAIIRLQALLEAGADSLINTKIAPNGDFGLFLDTTVGPFNKKQVTVNIPTEIPFDIPVLIEAHLASWSGDTDSSRFILGAQNIDDSWTTMLNTGFGNWPYAGRWFSETVTLPVEHDILLFEGTCQRYSGTNCDAWIRGPSVTFNPDLPAVGEEITVTYR